MSIYVLLFRVIISNLISCNVGSLIWRLTAIAIPHDSSHTPYQAELIVSFDRAVSLRRKPESVRPNRTGHVAAPRHTPASLSKGEERNTEIHPKKYVPLLPFRLDSL